ncbi:unnamed protein product [Nippostrongylus brasiliensis]|uniref:Cyclic nucleotide-binding domain-containing protein n=1 Tax=Nippostrongylus brasiliensis TaxID=27835 RepID=A0A0N4YPL4_NIPBR|nr:unnamed protein product [Nippostrongylus brasiliensis]
MYSVSGYASMPVSPFPHFAVPGAAASHRSGGPDVRSQASGGSGEGSGSGVASRNQANEHDESFEDLLRKRKAEEQKLPDDIRRKRASIRKAPSFPSEHEVQGKIEKFLQVILHVTSENNLSNEAAELFAQKKSHFAGRESTLYKCRVQNLKIKIRSTKDRIVAVMQGVAMSYYMYGLLITAKVAAEQSRSDYCHRNYEGIVHDPTFIDVFARKEVEFLDTLLNSAESEVYEAEFQIENEMQSKWKDNLQAAINRQEQTLAKVLLSIKDIQKQISDLGTAVGWDSAKKGAETEPSRSRRLSLVDNKGEEVQDLECEVGQQQEGSGAAEGKAKDPDRAAEIVSVESHRQSPDREVEEDPMDSENEEPASERQQKEVRQMTTQNDVSEVQDALSHGEHEKRPKISSKSDGKVHRSIYKRSSKEGRRIRESMDEIIQIRGGGRRGPESGGQDATNKLRVLSRHAAFIEKLFPKGKEV